VLVRGPNKPPQESGIFHNRDKKKEEIDKREMKRRCALEGEGAVFGKDRPPKKSQTDVKELGVQSVARAHGRRLAQITMTAGEIRAAGKEKIRRHGEKGFRTLRGLGQGMGVLYTTRGKAAERRNDKAKGGGRREIRGKRDKTLGKNLSGAATRTPHPILVIRNNGVRKETPEG